MKLEKIMYALSKDNAIRLFKEKNENNREKEEVGVFGYYDGEMFNGFDSISGENLKKEIKYMKSVIVYNWDTEGTSHGIAFDDSEDLEDYIRDYGYRVIEITLESDFDLFMKLPKYTILMYLNFIKNVWQDIWQDLQEKACGNVENALKIDLVRYILNNKKLYNYFLEICGKESEE